MVNSRHSNRGSFAFRATRRQVLAWGAAGAGGALLAGSPLSAFAQNATMPQDLESSMVFGCNGGNTETQFRDHFFPTFKERTGVDVGYLAGQPANNVAKVRAQRSNPAVDALWLAGAITYQAIDEGLMATLDRSRLPSLSDIPPEVANQDAAAPVGVTVVGIIYNKDVFAQNGWDEPTSWWDMWDTKFKGHVGCYSINTTAANSWMAKIETMLTGQYKDNFDAFFEKAKELKPNMLEFFTSAGAWETAVQQGDAWIGMNTGVRAKQLIDAGMPIGFVEPKEGFCAYPTWIGVVEGCKSPNAAHAWIEYLISPEGQRLIAEYIGYAPVNPRATVPAGQEVFFPNIEKVFVPDFRFLEANLEKIVDRWNREVEG